jgi:hypothetical protein
MMYACPIHSTATVARMPAHRIHAEMRLRRSGLEAATIAARRTSGSQTTPATMTVPSIQSSAGSKIWSIGAVSTHGKPIFTPSLDLRGRANGAEVRCVPGDDRRGGENETHCDRAPKLADGEKRATGREEGDARLR